jgi:hypothetical protein
MAEKVAARRKKKAARVPGIQGRLPDFLVIGAQKSGTTELCGHLGSHPSIYFSRPKELYFFCRDDVRILPYPFFERRDEWREFAWPERQRELLEGYARKFEPATPEQICGEGTPFYLPSIPAAERIRDALPKARFVVILRNPVDRAYSAYWHHVKMRRASETFENHLRYETGGTLELGHYEEQLRAWVDLVGRKRLHVVLFEEYVHDRLTVANGVFDFLGVDLLPAEPLESGRNRALVPRSFALQRFLNRLERAYPAYSATIEYESAPPRKTPELLVSKAIRGLGRLNLGPGRYPAMRDETREALDEHYRRRNRGLAELLERDLAVWGW